MQTAYLKRLESGDQGTVGVLLLNPEPNAINPKAITMQTLELPWRNNARGVSCIPKGSYRVVWAYSPRFKRYTYRLQNVPGRDGILIHSANLAGDTTKGFASQLNGCIAPFKTRGVLAISQETPKRYQLAGLVSRPMVQALEAWGNHKPFQLEIS